MKKLFSNSGKVISHIDTVRQKIWKNLDFFFAFLIEFRLEYLSILIFSQLLSGWYCNKNWSIHQWLYTFFMMISGFCIPNDYFRGVNELVRPMLISFLPQSQILCSFNTFTSFSVSSYPSKEHCWNFYSLVCEKPAVACKVL